MKSRKDMPKFLTELGLNRFGVEVGVHQGRFSEHILSNWDGEALYSVDPWVEQLGVKFDASNVSQSEHDNSYQICKERLAKFKKRSRIIKKYSIDAATLFADGALDFVYIDARHDYRSVMADLVFWWPKVKVGGMMSGHDYKNSFVRKNLVEVQRAVTDFFSYSVVAEVKTTTDDNIPSWYVIKEENGQ